MSERFAPPDRAPLDPGDLAVRLEAFYDPPRPVEPISLSERLVFDPCCRLDGCAGWTTDRSVFLVLARTWVEEAHQDLLVLWAPNGTPVGFVGCAWDDVYRHANVLPQAA